MTILELAMEKERDAESYYRELAGKTDDSGLQSILNKLATVEAKHFQAIQKLKEEGGDVEVDGGDDRKEMQSLFTEWDKQAQMVDSSTSEVDLYKIAQDRETEAREFYLEKADETGSPQGSTLFHQLADQELMHYQILDTIIEHVSRPEPGNWLENAEWYHHEEY